MAAETFGIAASALAVVELSAKVVQKCTQYTQGVLSAKADIERITGGVKGLGELAASIQRLSSKSPAELDTLQRLQPLLTQCQSRLTEIQAGLEPGKRQTTMKKLGIRALTWPFKSKDTEKIIADLHRLTQLLSDAMQVDQTAILLDIDQRAILEKLPVADGAAYDSHANEHSPQCLPNTRVEVLHEITQWAEDPSTQPVFWLNGMAGTGKSTISRTLASVHDKKGGLGASFFFKRGEGDRGEMSKLLTTIASQMVQQIPSMAEYVQQALGKNETICFKALREQFSTLIKEPISQVESRDGTQATRLIIIDALDECDRYEDITTLIELLASTPKPGNIQLKFFLTSRPEVPTRLGFNAIHGSYHNRILHEVAEPVIEHDVTAYFKHELSKIRDKFNKIVLGDGRLLPAEWPTEVEITILVEMAVPLFIFAATVCRFINDTRVGRPDRLLERVLHYRTKSQVSKLDATYLPVLTQMVDGLNSSELDIVTKRFRQVVGSIVTLANPLPTSSLAHLLDISVETIDEALWTLHSVLFIPKSREQPLRILHLSFRDFLVNPERCEDPFWINEKDTHRELAINCLRVLKKFLKTDLC
ncbi:hypothetical protein E8E14_000831 [Neopestalotiopsis sp. 37M]|nr:hypothetical protein E8E14_000831 [Neopestalotiopsis sp. 37M]